MARCKIQMVLHGRLYFLFRQLEMVFNLPAGTDLNMRPIQYMPFRAFFWGYSDANRSSDLNHFIFLLRELTSR